MDGGFEHLREEISLLGIYLNIVSRSKHVLEIERNNRTVKERVCLVVQTLPFKKNLRHMVIEIVKAIIC